MPKRSSKNISEIAAQLMHDTAGIKLEGKNPAAVALGRKGGLKGGRARADMLSAEERSSIASRAARMRWERKAAENVE
jgi:hypothetical protein